MKIRAAKASDRKAIDALISLYPKELVQDHTPSLGSFYVAEEKGRVVGCCAIDIYNRKLAELRSLSVSPKHQGKGIATALVNACVQRARKRGVYQVLAITSNLAMFEKFDFHSFNKEKYAMFKYLR